jgi:hypothetical protein
MYVRSSALVIGIANSSARIDGRKSADEFQRDTLPRLAQLALGEKHRAHAAGTQFAHEAIRADALACRMRARIGHHGRIEGLTQRCVGFGVMRKQTLDGSAPFRIAFLGRLAITDSRLAATHSYRPRRMTRRWIAPPRRPEPRWRK